jgi:hypothetical protein
MISVRCKNKYINKKEELATCGRFLGAISSAISETLKADIEESVVFRCPQCCSPYKFISLHGDGNGGIVQETLTDDKIDGTDEISNSISSEQMY